MILSTADYAFVQRLLLERAAIRINVEQEYLVRSRLEPVAKRAGLSDLRALVEQLRREPYGALHSEVVEAMTTNETSFFRELDENPGDETFPGIVVLRLDGGLFFATSDALEDRVRDIALSAPDTRTIILDCAEPSPLLTTIVAELREQKASAEAREAREAAEAEWEIPKVPEVSDTNFDEYELMERSWAGTIPAGLEIPARDTTM